MPLALAGELQPRLCRFDRDAQLVIARQQLSIIGLQSTMVELVKDITGVYEDLDRVFNFLRGIVDGLPLVNRVEVINNFNLCVSNRLVVKLQPPP